MDKAYKVRMRFVIPIIFGQGFEPPHLHHYVPNNLELNGGRSHTEHFIVIARVGETHRPT